MFKRQSPQLMDLNDSSKKTVKSCQNGILRLFVFKKIAAFPTNLAYHGLGLSYRLGRWAALVICGIRPRMEILDLCRGQCSIPNILKCRVSELVLVFRKVYSRVRTDIGRHYGMISR